MATLDLKRSIHAAVDHADERLLKMIKAVVESYQEKKAISKSPQNIRKCSMNV